MKKYTLALLVLLVSCNMQEDKNATMHTLDISIENSIKEINSTEILSSITCIPLETNDTLLIDEIRKVVVKDDYYYVADVHAIYKFNAKGNIEAVINCLGPGPNEYAGISDFQIDADGFVWILSRKTKTLKQYDWVGSQLQRISLKYWVSSIQIIDENSILLYTGNEVDGDNKNQLKVLDLTTKEVISNYLPIDKKKSKYLHVVSDNKFSLPNIKNSSCYFFQAFNDTIYEVTSKRIKPLFLLKLGKYNIPSSLFDEDYENVMFFFQALNKGNYAYGTSLFVESKENYYASFYYDKKCFISDISKKTLKSNHTFNKIKETSLLHGYVIDLAEQRIFPHNGELILPVTPNDIIEYANENLTSKQQKELEKMLDYKTMDQNPVLLHLKLK